MTYAVRPMVVVTALGIPLLAAVGSAQGQNASEARSVPDEVAFFRDAAYTAWRFIERNYVPGTGMVKAHDTYQYVTVWDVGSMLASYHAALKLGIIPQADFDQRVGTLLRTSSEMSLFEQVAYNKLYDARTGRSVNRAERPSEAGFGWSVIDLGRLLTILKVIETHHPQHAEAARAAVERMNPDRLVSEGYLIGRDLDPQTGEARSYQEGKIGYEQYAAEGLALWGIRAEKALSFRENTAPVEVMGVSLYSDTRGDDKLTSEPFVLMGLELGWRSPEWREAAWRVLAAQKARYDETGRITMVSEDAVPVPPHYFYYYSVYDNGRAFTVSGAGSSEALDEPRWISTKAAFGWHALLPSSYTWDALQAISAARDPVRGWSAGVYEESHRSTGTPNINTAALVLEATLFYMQGGPLLDQ
jgi:hypothetical protein